MNPIKHLRSPFEAALQRAPRLAVALFAVSLLGACNTMDSVTDWGGDEETSPAPAATAEAPAPVQPAPTEGERSGQENNYPDLNNLPEKPVDDRTAEERRAIAESLVSDRERAKHSAEELHGGTEMAAPPPPPPGTPAEIPPAAAATTTTTPAAATTTTETPAGPVTPPAAEKPTKPDTPPPGDTPAPSQAGTETTPPESMPPPQLRSSLITTPPSLAAEGLNVSGMDFSEFRPKPVVIPADDRNVQVEPETQVASAVTLAGVGTPQPQTALLREAAHRDSAAPLMVFFGDGSSDLPGGELAVLQEAARSYFAHGGTIRVVGHASPDGKMVSETDLLLLNFDKSLERARAVAASLIGFGVPASAIVVEAVGDAVPLPAELAADAPQGDAAFRRAEIYLQ